MNKYLRIALKGAFFILFGSLISKLFNYFYRLSIARFLGVEDYGAISLAIAVISFALIFSIAGMNHGIIRFFPYYSGKHNTDKAFSIYYSAQRITLILSIFFTLLLIVFAEFIADLVFQDISLAPFIRIFSLSVPFFAMSENMWAFFNANKKPKLFFLSNYLFDSSIKFALTLVLLVWGFGLMGVAISYVSAMVLTFVLSLYLVNTKILKKKFKLENIYPELTRYSIPLMFAGILSTILIWTDTILLGIFRNTTEVGLYNAAVPTAHLISLPAVALVTLFIPIFTELLAQKKIKMMKNFTSAISRWMYISSLPIFLLLVVFGEEILGILFGSEFSLAYIALVIVSFKFLLELPGNIASGIISSYGKSKIILKLTLLGTIVNVILNFLLIPSFGIIGAAWATLVSIFIITIIAIVQAKRISKINSIHLEIYKPVIASLIPALIIIFIDNLLFTSTPLYAIFIYTPFFLISYILLIYLFKGIKKEDTQLLNIILTKLSKTHRR